MPGVVVLSVGFLGCLFCLLGWLVVRLVLVLAVVWLLVLWVVLAGCWLGLFGWLVGWLYLRHVVSLISPYKPYR